MSKNNSTFRLCAVGDNAAFNNDKVLAYEHASPFLQDADIRFGQNERHYNDRKDLLQLITSCPGGVTEINSTKKAQTLKKSNFDVMSFASNHAMDLGPDIMMETVGVLKKLGFAVIGVGRDIKEARKPAIFERNGIKIGFLAYCSVLRSNYDAGVSRAGCAPMRAATLYHQLDYQPGTPPRIVTFPYKDDLAAIIEDINKTKTQVDILAVSFHWGIHMVNAVLANYQKEVAHAVIDAGADVILGHHPHILKGIEVYKGKPIFYSMGNFAFDPAPDCFTPEEMAIIRKTSDFGPTMKELYFDCDPKLRKKSMIVRCDFANKEIKKASFLPVQINDDYQPVVISKKDKAFDEALKYMTYISESQGLKTRFTVEGDEIVVDLT